MGYQRILAALDRSPQSAVILTKAMEIARTDGSHLILFHCLALPAEITLDYGDRYGANLTDFMTMTRRHLEAQQALVHDWLTTAADQAKEQGITTEWDWHIGDPGSGICSAAQRWNADLVIVGRRGRQGLSEVLLGSVSNFVVHRVSCSVLVVQGQAASA